MLKKFLIKINYIQQRKPKTMYYILVGESFLSVSEKIICPGKHLETKIIKEIPLF